MYHRWLGRGQSASLEMYDIEALLKRLDASHGIMCHPKTPARLAWASNSAPRMLNAPQVLIFLLLSFFPFLHIWILIDSDWK